MLKILFSAALIALIANRCQLLLREVFNSFANNWRAQPIEEFPYQCRRLEHKYLESCSDMWLDEKYRVLYATCVGSAARDAWDPRLSRFNYTGHRSRSSWIMAIYVDEPRKDGLFRMHPILPSNYGNAPGDGKLDPTAFDVQLLDYGSTHRFWFVNQRPSYDANGIMLDATAHGANYTVDVYEHKNGGRKMSFIASGWSAALHSVNGIAFMGSNNFVVSNERSAQFGLRRKLDPVLGGGSLVHHDDWSNSYRTTPQGLSIPGSILRGKDDYIYTSSQTDSKIRIFRLGVSGFFEKAYTINMQMPTIGLSVDQEGDIWAVGRSNYDPTGLKSTHAIFKIENLEDTPPWYLAHKMLEDRDSEYLRGASVAVHDVKSKRLFAGGPYMRFITLCKKI